MQSDAGFELRAYRVSGRVQGVGFRWWTRECALKLGLAGWVANRPDGSVEVHARGVRSALESFEAHLRFGPSNAHVQSVDRLAPDEGLPAYDFEIRR